MSFVIYHKETTLFLRVFRQRHWQDAVCKTEGAAKAMLKREAAKSLIKPGQRGVINENDYAIADKGFFHRSIEKQETKYNLLSGAAFSQPVNTPSYCDPSTEAYHSM